MVASDAGVDAGPSDPVAAWSAKVSRLSTLLAQHEGGDVEKVALELELAEVEYSAAKARYSAAEAKYSAAEEAGDEVAMDRANQAKAEAAQAKAEAETMAKLRNAQVGATRVEEGSLKERVHTLEIQLYTSKLSWLQKDMSDKDWISVRDEIQADLRRAKALADAHAPNPHPGTSLGQTQAGNLAATKTTLAYERVRAIVPEENYNGTIVGSALGRSLQFALAADGGKKKGNSAGGNDPRSSLASTFSTACLPGTNVPDPSSAHEEFLSGLLCEWLCAGPCKNTDLSCVHQAFLPLYTPDSAKNASCAYVFDEVESQAAQTIGTRFKKTSATRARVDKIMADGALIHTNKDGSKVMVAVIEVKKGMFTDSHLGQLDDQAINVLAATEKPVVGLSVGVDKNGAITMAAYLYTPLHCDTSVDLECRSVGNSSSLGSSTGPGVNTTRSFYQIARAELVREGGETAMATFVATLATHAGSALDGFGTLTTTNLAIDNGWVYKAFSGAVHGTRARVPHLDLVQAFIDSSATWSPWGTSGRMGMLTMRELKLGGKRNQDGGRELPRRALLDLVRAVAALHLRGFVHGDIRPANVFVGLSSDSHVALPDGWADIIGEAVGLGEDDRSFTSTLIDFDWSAEPGSVYPDGFNHRMKDVTRAIGAQAGKPMLFSHDWAALADTLGRLGGDNGLVAAVWRSEDGEDGSVEAVAERVAQWWFSSSSKSGRIAGGTVIVPNLSRVGTGSPKNKAVVVDETLVVGAKRSRSSGEPAAGGDHTSAKKGKLLDATTTTR